MFEKLKETIRGWFADPRVHELDVRFTATRTKTFEELARIEHSARERMNIISDGIDKNATFFNERMRDIVDLRMRDIVDLRKRIEYLERRLRGDLFKLTTNDVAVAKKMGMSLEEYAKNKLAILCNPPAPVKRGRPKGSKNKPVPVVEKPARKPRTKE